MVSAASNAVDHSSSILVSPRPGAENEEPGQPKMLAIPRLDLKMPITAVTVDDKGAMAIPDRPSEIGWYAYGPRPDLHPRIPSSAVMSTAASTGSDRWPV